MTYLGKLPSEANLTVAQKRELLTYHRTKQAREAICPECKDRWREERRECYFCQRTYSEKRGVVYSDDSGMSLKDWVRGADLLQGREPTNAAALANLRENWTAFQRGAEQTEAATEQPPEQQRKALAERLSQNPNVLMLDGPLTAEQTEAFLARRKAGA